MCLYPITIHTRPKDPSQGRLVTVSCGKCLECLQQKSNEWAFRIMNECSFYQNNCFITLTYNNEYLPSDNSVSRREVQLFMKRLRQELSPLKVRFFACGEYGKQRKRPHYHIIIFGWFPSDSYFFQHKDGTDLYRSPTLEKVWKFGFSTVGYVTLDTARYCAKYMQKWQFKKSKKEGYDVYPPFVQMSNRPGIGYNAVYSSDLISDKVYVSGRFMKIPRYYLKVMERDGIYLDEFKERRERNGALIAELTNIEDKRKRFYERFLTKNKIT